MNFFLKNDFHLNSQDCDEKGHQGFQLYEEEHQYDTMILLVKMQPNIYNIDLTLRFQELNK